MKTLITRRPFLLFLAATASSSLYAEQNLTIVGVEEDWEIQLEEPESLKAAPQVVMWMSPTDSISERCFGIDMNHVQRPDFASGGFQTKAFLDEEVVDQRFSENGHNWVHTGETVQWTQRMFLTNQGLTFEVTNGYCQSWGSFGGSSSRVSLPAGPIENLNLYNPAKSLAWSGVGYASNRVREFRLRAVRLYTDNGQVFDIPPPTPGQ